MIKQRENAHNIGNLIKNDAGNAINTKKIMDTKNP